MVVPLGEVERGDNLPVFEPLIDAVLLADVAALEHDELLVELLLKLALPLEGEVGRADDQDAIGQAAKLQFADQQPGHDGFAGAGVIGEQETDAGELEQVVVNRLKLMRQRIDARDGKSEIGIEFVGDPKRVGLKPQPKQIAIAAYEQDGSWIFRLCMSARLSVTGRNRSV